jgi:hypothetical protein
MEAIVNYTGMKEKKPNMEKMEIKQPVKMAPHWKWLLFTAGVFFPVAIMLFLYNQNAAYIRFDFILAICGIMMLISSAVWWGAYWIFRSPLSSFAVCAIGWTACFSSSYIIMFIQLLYPLKHNGLLCVAAIAALLCLFAALQLRGRGGEGQAELFISVMVGVFLLISGFSSVRTAFAMRSGAFNAGQMPLKTEFVAAKTGANAPNVYWFHCDGMLGFSSMEKYFGDSQNEFLYALKDRGFAVNKTAMLEAGHITWIAIPALMCPYFYDQWLNTRLSSHEKAMQLRSRLLDYGGLLSSARFKNETINAFEAAGYATHTIATVDIYFYPTTDFFYYPSDDAGFVKLERKSIEDKIVQLTDYFQQRDFLIHFIPSLFVLFRYVDYIGISKNGTIMKPILTEEESHQDLYCQCSKIHIDWRYAAIHHCI